MLGDDGIDNSERHIAVQNFERKCGATICKDLKGIGTGKVLCPCPECVRNAVLSLGEVLEE